MTTTSERITQLLESVRQGDGAAADELLPIVYEELRRIAAGYLRRERREHTLQPTALVHEAYLRLVDQRGQHWQNRAHFVGIAARMMRRILVDYARRRLAGKRAGEAVRVTLDESLDAPAERDADLVALDDALRELEAVDPQLSRVVELRYFGGLTTREAAEALGISTRTLEREWATARAWLRERVLGGA
jgi:RNA polymerase sigma factor (TIGR02999 family)